MSDVTEVPTEVKAKPEPTPEEIAKAKAEKEFAEQVRVEQATNMLVTLQGMKSAALKASRDTMLAGLSGKSANKLTMAQLTALVEQKVLTQEFLNLLLTGTFETRKADGSVVTETYKFVRTFGERRESSGEGAIIKSLIGFPAMSDLCLDTEGNVIPEYQELANAGLAVRNGLDEFDVKFEKELAIIEKAGFSINHYCSNDKKAAEAKAAKEAAKLAAQATQA
jgi:hypothetical protein